VYLRSLWGRRRLGVECSSRPHLFGPNGCCLPHARTSGERIGAGTRALRQQIETMRFRPMCGSADRLIELVTGKGAPRTKGASEPSAD